MDVNSALFYILAIILLYATYKVVSSVNPIFSALHLAVAMVTLALLFFQLGAPFIAGVQLIVYAGAVMVLFVMVVMLFDLRTELKAYTRGEASNVLKIAASACLAGLIIGAVPLSTSLVQPGEKQPLVETSTKDLANVLFNQYVFSFEALGVLLLVVAVGVVAVSRIKGGTHARG